MRLPRVGGEVLHIFVDELTINTYLAYMDEHDDWSVETEHVVFNTIIDAITSMREKEESLSKQRLR